MKTGIRFVAVDHSLRDMLGRVVDLLHAQDRDIEVSSEASPCTAGDIELGGPHDISVVCISVLPNDPGMSLLSSELEQGRPCGVVMCTEERERWKQLSEVHAKTPLLFAVATGGPRDKFKNMFPGISVLYVTDLDAPYDRIVAKLIERAVTAVEVR